jgi:Na+-driven multidrug efflux pump
MSQVIDQPAEPVGDEGTPPPPEPRFLSRDDRTLLTQLIFLAAPILAEHLLHIFVSVTDTALANYLPADAPEAAAAVGNIGYIFWFVGLFSGAIGTGSTAIIAREVGARHRRRANSVCGQSILFAAICGVLP